MKQEHVIVWFRQDLRVQDNPALSAAVRCRAPVIPVYIHAPTEEGEWPAGGASRWWLNHALASLDDELGRLGSSLLLRTGTSLGQLGALTESHRVSHVFWNRRHEPEAVARDRHIERELCAAGVEVEHFNASLLWEPDAIENKSGAPYRVFTPFWKHARTVRVPEPLALNADSLPAPARRLSGKALEELRLLPRNRWDDGLTETWKPTLEGAHEGLEKFVHGGLRDYASQRDMPGVDGTSRLSPFLHFGQIGPRQIWHALHQSGAAEGKDGYTFLSELAWRDFAYHLLHHFPGTPTEPLVPAYREFPWQPDDQLLNAWQRGMTGYPIVDAGMRQLWRTGWMHNRVRMITASFLVKHLLQPWQDGARWFWDTLVDADLANNTMGWQWTAGCGADAAPYFRIFNPMLQGAKFDPGGEYVRAWVPELARLPDAHIHQPWKATDEVLEQAQVELGSDYPRPIVDHRRARQRALDALAENKRNNRTSNAG